jgi:choice-of-anchor B domain-containing protein
MNKQLLPLLCLLLPFIGICQQEATLLGTWNDPVLEGSWAYDNTYNEVWGMSINGHDYAVVGSTAGTHFIDITDPSAPFEAFLVEGAAQGTSIIHRDYHDYNGYLYAVCDEGPSTLQIMDISQLPESVEVVYDSNEYIRTAHNIYIDTTNARLYCFALSGGPQNYSAMRIYSIADPLNLEFLGEYNNFGGLFAGHVHDGYVRNNIAFLNCGNDGFALVNFTDPDNPETLSTLTNYPFQGYNHSGWLSDDARYYYMADENHGYDMKVLDVSDPCDVNVEGVFDAEVSNPNSIPHNQLVACNYLYVAYYYEGMVVYDISDPSSPEKVLYYDTSSEPEAPSYKGAWGIYPMTSSNKILVLDMQEGLFVFEGMGDNCESNANLEDVDLSCLTPSSTEDILPSRKASIFPQPASHTFQVDFHLDKAELNAQFQLVNLDGKVVQTWSARSLQAGEVSTNLQLLSSVSPGIYLLQMQGEHMAISERLIVQQ